MPTTTVLIDRLRYDPTLRRPVGWSRVSEVPSESTFSRALPWFAETRLPERMHGALLRAAYSGSVVGHISRDSTAIVGRESIHVGIQARIRLFFRFFPGSVSGCPGPFHSVPHRRRRPGTPEAPAGEAPAGPKVIRFRAGPRRSVRASGGGRRPVLPLAAVAEKGVGGHGQPAHDGHEGDPVWLSPVPEALVQVAHVGGAPAGRHRRHVQDVPRPPPPAADVAPAFQGAAVAGEGGHAGQGGGLAVADGAQLLHPRDQGRGRDGSDARHRGQDAVAFGELRRPGDRHADPPLQRRDGGVDVPGDPADLRAGRPPADLRQDGPEPGPLVHKFLPQPRHVAEPVDGGAGRRRGPHVRERGPEGRQYPGVHPVRLRERPGGLREVPRLPRVHHEGGETPGARRLRQRPVHAPRGLHDGPRGAGLPEDAADLSEAVRVVGGREVTPVDVDVGVRLLTSIPATIAVMLSRSWPRDDPVP